MRQIANHLGRGLTTVHRRIREAETMVNAAEGGTRKT
jgi:hypothetical protein